MDNSVIIGLGTFDGVHIAHQVLIRRVLEISRETGLPGCVYLFRNHPLAVLTGRHPGLLTTAEEKVALLERLGMRRIVWEDFTPEFARQTPEEFADRLAHQLRARHVVAGFNYSFARGGQGDCTLLGRLCAQRGMGLHVIPPVKIGDTVVSSTAVREALTSGAVERANDMLGYEYTLPGRIVDGHKIGREMGFPTANLTLTAEKVLPPDGVYLTRLTLEGTEHNAVTNIGVRPTFGARERSVETFIPGFAGDLYGTAGSLALVKRLRPEMKFDGAEALRAQIAQDVMIATQYFAHEKRRRPSYSR